MAFYAADRIGYDSLFLERFGMDTRTETSRAVADRMYFLLRERVRSEMGLIRGEVAPPPEWCDYNETSKFYDAQKAWQRSLCKVPRWTKDEDLDEYLTSPVQMTAA